MSVIGKWSLDDERINELEKKVRSLERKVKRRDNKIIELEKENKSLKACNKNADLRIQELEDILENLSSRHRYVNGRPTDTRYKGSSHEMDHEDMGG